MNSVFNASIRGLSSINFLFPHSISVHVRVSVLTVICKCDSVRPTSDMGAPEVTRTQPFSWQAGVGRERCSEDTDTAVWAGFGKLKIREYLVI